MMHKGTVKVTQAFQSSVRRVSDRERRYQYEWGKYANPFWYHYLGPKKECTSASRWSYETPSISAKMRDRKLLYTPFVKLSLFGLHLLVVLFDSWQNVIPADLRAAPNNKNNKKK